MQRILVTLVCTIALAYVGICFLLYLFQRSLIYFPTPRTNTHSENEMTLDVPDASLVLSVRRRDGPDALIYFGGNAEDVSFNLSSLSRAFPNHSVYLMHYRGYGGSSGAPTETALHADALVLFDKVYRDHFKVTVIGRSLGSGVAVQLASIRPVTHLILVTPYDSLQNVAARQFPYLPVSWLLRDKFESWRHAPGISVPTLLVVAERDEIIGRENTDNLFRHFRDGVASMKIISNADHNSISDKAEYITALESTR